MWWLRMKYAKLWFDWRIIKGHSSMQATGHRALFCWLLVAYRSSRSNLIPKPVCSAPWSRSHSAWRCHSTRRSPTTFRMTARDRSPALTFYELPATLPSGCLSSSSVTPLYASYLHVSLARRLSSLIVLWPNCAPSLFTGPSGQRSIPNVRQWGRSGDPSLRRRRTLRDRVTVGPVDVGFALHFFGALYYLQY